MKAITYTLMAVALMAATTTGCKTDDEPVWPTEEPTPTPDPNPGEEPSATGTAAIRFNELNGNKPQKFIELYNTSDATVDIAGMTIIKNGDEVVYVAPANTQIPAHGFLVLNSDATDCSMGFTAGLSAKKSLRFDLQAPDGKTIDTFINPSAAKGQVWDETDPVYNGENTKQAYGRCPDGSGSWYMIDLTPGASNNSASKTTEIKW